MDMLLAKIVIQTRSLFILASHIVYGFGMYPPMATGRIILRYDISYRLLALVLKDTGMIHYYYN